ncbi:MAG: S26 family signal peptidase [Acidimicrobiales bacterium]
MEPALCHGDGLIGIRTGRARASQRRLFEHPYRPGTWLVKQVDAVRPDATMWVLSDNVRSPGADSREFGSIPVEGTYLVVARITGRLLGARSA